MQTTITEAVTAPLYSYADADRIAGVSRGTSKRWLEGYARHNGGDRRLLPAVSPGGSAAGGGVSFADLIEVIAIRELRGLGFSTQALRGIVEASRSLFGGQHPLSTLSFKTDGRDLFVRRDSVLYDVLRRKGQSAWDSVLAPFLETLDYHESIACQWWPLGKGLPVVVDPAVGFGLPVIAGSGVRTEIIIERVQAGDSAVEIADDFNISPAEIDFAIQYEVKRAA